jgi:hypothetical protein
MRTISRALVLLGFFTLCPLAMRTTAGTTGGLGGIVTDEDTHAPVAGVTITAGSPSQISHVMTDTKGHYVFITLAPDTYTVTAEKQGYNPTTVRGIDVTTDQQLSVDLVIPTHLR